MNTFKWTENLSVGNKQIDEDHQGLFKLINDLQSADLTRSYLTEIINQLEDYTHEHFSREEELMQEVGFPGFEEHIKEHHMFIEWLDTVKKTYQRSAESAFLVNDLVNNFLNDWLTKHILQEDMKYRDFILSKKSSKD